jgi:alkylation response protein AidB-like acyl-CoA dehydrogenase
MELLLTDEDRAFRQTIRDFIGRARPADLLEKSRRRVPFSPDDHRRWQRILDDAGYGAPAWPVEHGGCGWSPLQRLIFAEELLMNDCPRQSPYGLAMVGPIIMAFGTEAQRRHYLPRIRSAEHWWCQGYSERNSGSDLASLRTRAVLDADGHYRVNGHKLWTSTAHEANMMFALVRTDSSGKRQQGITFLLIPMDSPGLTVRPLRTIDGNHTINEVFFDDVRVPEANRVGEEGQGWTYSNALLQNERLLIADIPRSKRRLARIRELAAREQAGGGPLAADPGFARRVAALEVDLLMLEYGTLRYMSEVDAGRVPGAEVSILKIRGSEIGQALNALLVEVAGTAALAYSPSDDGEDAWPSGLDDYRGIVEQHLFYRASTIYGGATEVLKSVIARRVLEL